MLPDLLIDNHVHTSLCNHAVGDMEEYVRAAIERGMKRITFLEHLEEGIGYEPRTWLTDQDFDFYFREGERLRGLFGDRLFIGLGVEVGYNPSYRSRIIERLKQRQWDCIGLSYHFCALPGQSRHLNLLSRKKKNIEIMGDYGSEKLLSHYFDTLIEAVDTIPAQVLCHLDAGLRHFPGLTFSETHLEQIETLLKAVKSAGMALEINTSGYEIRDQPFPPPQVIMRAQELGIRLVAGSDSHRPQDIGRHFDRLPDLFNRDTRP